MEAMGGWSAGLTAFLRFLQRWSRERQLGGMSQSDVSGLARRNNQSLASLTIHVTLLLGLGRGGGASDFLGPQLNPETPQSPVSCKLLAALSFARSLNGHFFFLL